MSGRLEQYVKCIYCKYCEYHMGDDGLTCVNAGVATPVRPDDSCLFFDVYAQDAPTVSHKKWKLKSCGLHGCNVVPSRYNDGCECTACRGTHCHNCGVRTARCSFINIHKTIARCAFCMHEK